MKNILLDASSAILLFKAALFDALLSVYQVSWTQSVLQELIRGNQCGAETFRRYSTGFGERIVALQRGPFPAIKTHQELKGLDLGESDTIRCFATGGWDFIITDDGGAAKYCLKHDIPFVNALLFPRLLYLGMRISLADSHDKMAELIGLGRYSREVIDRAANSRKESLLFAIPGICGIDK
jgi:hypothetical protein